MSKEPLKPCPFCGSEPTLDHDEWNNASIKCTDENCGCVFRNNNLYEHELIEAWNDRHRSWDLLMEWLDEIYPADIFDGSSGDIGPQILVKLREINELRATDN